MSWGYTLDDIRQTQAYLLSDAERIARLFRSNSGNPLRAHNKVYAPSMVASTDSQPIITPNPSNFIEFPDKCLNSLQPEIKVYKTYIDLDGNELNYLLPMGTYLESTGKVEQGVVVKNVEFTRLGGNPAELDTNIKFNLKLFAKDITTFFVKNEVEPVENYDPGKTPDTRLQQAQAQAQALQITEDLEAEISQASEIRAAQAAGVRITASEQAFLNDFEVRQGRRTFADIDVSGRAQEHRDNLNDLTNSIHELGPNGERKVAWIDLIKIDPGQELNAMSSELLTSESSARIKVEIGYVPVPTKPVKFTGSDEEWAVWAEAIEEQREVFYLSLTKHQFDFRGYDGVGLDVHFIATSNAKRLSPRSDIFNDINMNDQIRRLSSDIERKEEEIRKAGADEEPSERISECIADLSDQIENMEGKILKYRSQNKLKLLRQLYLSSQNPITNRLPGTKVFGRRWKPTREKRAGETESDVARRQIINHGSGDGTGYYYMQDLHVPSDNETGAISFPRRELHSIDLDAGEEDGELGITREHIEGGIREDMFVFLGDIIESAFELLTPSKKELQLGPIQVRVRATKFHAVVGFFDIIGENATEAAARIQSELEAESALDRATGALSFTAPFPWRESDSNDHVTGQIERFNESISEFGGILSGEVSYTNPNSTTLSPIPITVKIRDIPIALDIFRSWWMNTYVKSGKNSLPLNDFIVALMKFVEREVFARTPLDFGRTEDRVDDPKFIINNINVDDASIVKLFDNKNVFTNIGISDIKQVEDFEQNSVLVIEQVDSNPWLSEAVSVIVFGETTKGVLKKINFEREDIPGHAEARLFSDRSSTASNIALREKYNTSIETLGLTCYKPGSLLYLDPLPLDLGYVGSRNSLARSLGLGGMYRVVNLTSTLSFDSSGNTWNTKVNTKWESFGDGSTGAQLVTHPSPIVLGKCIEDEIAYLEEQMAEHNRIAAEKLSVANQLTAGSGAQRAYLIAFHGANDRAIEFAERIEALRTIGQTS